MCLVVFSDKPKSRQNRWKEITTEDMKCFLAHCMIMGIIRKPKIEDYWAREAILRTPFFGKYMSRNKFQSILGNLHVNDNRNMPKNKDHPRHNPMHKVGPFLEMCQKNFKSCLIPERDLSLDEGCCPWKGRGFKQYNPSKPNKYHIKLYKLCEASSGFVLGLEIHGGKIDLTGVGPQDPTAGKTTQLVFRLLETCDLLGKGYHLYTDNWYTSPQLLEELHFVDTYGCGTVRANRIGMPKAFTVAKLKKGEMMFRRSDNLLALKWCDRKDVTILSSIHDAFLVDVKVNWKGEVISKPEAVVDYNNKMLGVDKNDQVLAYYAYARRQRKWSKKLLMHLFDTLVTNAHIMHKKFYQKHNACLLEKDRVKILTHSQFILSLCKYLLPEAAQVQDKHDDETGGGRLQGKHFPDLVPKTQSKRKNPSRLCCVCAEVAKERGDTKERHWTCFWCPKCEKALCVGERKCFEIYHTQNNYGTRDLEAPFSPNSTDEGDSGVGSEMDRINDFLNSV